MLRRWTVLLAACALAAVPATARADVQPSHNIDGHFYFEGISCPSATQCTAVDYRQGQPPYELTFNPQNPGTPSSAAIDTQGGSQDVKCPSPVQCTALIGFAAVTFNPQSPGQQTRGTIARNGLPVSLDCPTTGQCTAVDTTGNVYTFNPAAPAPVAPAAVDPGQKTLRIACPTPAQCTAIDEGGNEVTFNPGAPGTPAPVKIDTVRPFDIDCPSATQCTIVDQDINSGPGYEVTINPQRATPAAPVKIDFKGLSAVSCPAENQCTATGPRNFVTFGPTAPGAPEAQPSVATPDDHAQSLMQLDCPTMHQCTGLDFVGNEVTFDPAPPVPPPATAKTLAIKAGASPTLVGVLPDAKPGTKVLARLTKGGRSAKKSTVKVRADHSFRWKPGKLKAGTYKARFLVAGKVVKSTTIKVKRR
jgi:hypothetical protein